MKISSWQQLNVTEPGWGSFKVLFSVDYHYLISQMISYKTLLTRLSVFDLMGSLPMYKFAKAFPEALVKKNFRHHSYLSKWITVGTNSKLTKKLKRKRWRMRYCRGFEKLQHIPNNLEVHSHTLDCAHAWGIHILKRKKKEGPKLSPLANLKTFYRKWRPKQSCPLLSWELSSTHTHTHTHTDSLQRQKAYFF